MEKSAVRRWFQLHLTTAFLLMLAASGLLYLNIQSQHILPGSVTAIQFISSRGIPGQKTISAQYKRPGWPFYQAGNLTIPQAPADTQDAFALCVKTLASFQSSGWDCYVGDTWSLTLNLIFAGLVLSALAVFCECFIRLRRETRIALLLTVAALAWANGRITKDDRGWKPVVCYGWPTVVYTEYPTPEGAPSSGVFYPGAGVQVLNVFINLFTGLALLTGVGFGVQRFYGLKKSGYIYGISSNYQGEE